ncbi:MAG: response regulator [Candidatus Moraniibacteriota bacterium]|nr:MAG: response regulator [Candidatus Moranbacteria bacterium]
MSKSIIIVEDEISIMKAMSIKLQNAGFQVEGAKEANEFFEKKGKKKFDLILLDLMLPKISGFEVLEKLRKEKNKVPVMVASNLSQEEDKKRAQDLGAVDYIVKSDTSLNQIVEKIQSFLEK